MNRAGAPDVPPPPPPEEAGLRRALRPILEGALGAVDPERLVLRALEDEPWPGPPGGSGRRLLAAVGKAAVPMARGAVRGVGRAPPEGGAPVFEAGVVLAPEDPDGAPPPSAPPPSPLRLLRGGHPLPTPGGVRGARAMLALADGAGAGDRLLALLSGGGSALLTLPAKGLALEELRTTTELLLRAGAPIHELNAVRKHLERLKGGGLARAAEPAEVRVLVVSDVVGDPLETIASGPFAPDPTRFGDALAVLDRRGLLDRVPGAVRRHLEEGAAGRVAETPAAGAPCFRRVTHRIVGNVATAVRAAEAAAREGGWHPHVLALDLQGEAREAGRRLGALARAVRRGAGPVLPPACLLAGGETTVTVRGDGRGGRNQELALGAALELDGEEGILVASFGTDGIDGPTDAAGALVTGSTLARARAAGLDPHEALRRNDAHPFHEALGDLLRTGPTGTNVMDVQVVLVQDRRPGGDRPGGSGTGGGGGLHASPFPFSQV